MYTLLLILPKSLYNDPFCTDSTPSSYSLTHETNLKDVSSGVRVTGRVQRVVLRGKMVYVDGHVVAEPGYGENVRTWKPVKPQQRFVPPIFKSDDILQVLDICSQFIRILFKTNLLKRCYRSQLNINSLVVTRFKKRNKEQCMACLWLNPRALQKCLCTTSIS